MDLDSLKRKSRMITAPGREASVRLAGLSVDDLISRLKIEDEKERKKLRKALPFWIIAAVVFVIAFVAIMVPGTGVPASSGLLLRGLTALLYVIIAVGVIVKLKNLKEIDYGEAVRPFLEKAAKRYEFGRAWYYVFAASVTLFLAYAAFLYLRDVFHRYFGVENALLVLLGTVVFFALVYTIGYWATRKGWKETKEPMFRQIRAMLGELGDEEPSPPYEDKV